MQRKALAALRSALLLWSLSCGSAPGEAQASGSLLPGAVVHAATFRPNSVAPGQMLTIFIAGVGPPVGGSPGLDGNGRLPTSFNGVEARFDGMPAPLFYVGRDQVTVLAPAALAGAHATRLSLVDVQRRRHATTLPVLPAAPGLFAHSDDPTLAVVTDGSGRVITRENPARPGQIVVFYAAGDGVRSPNLPDGAPSTQPFPRPDADVALTIAGSPAELLFVGAAPEFVGLLQINARLAEDLPSGDLPVQLLAGAQAGPAGSVLPAEGGRPYTPDGILIRPGQDIQPIVDAAPGGSTFRLAAGVHRMQRIAPRSFDVFVGEPGAVLNGSRLLTSFRKDGALWVADGQTQQNTPDGDCRDQANGNRYRGCRFPEDLYFDNEPLRQVESRAEVQPGSWYFDYGANRVYFADDPTGRTVEIGVLAHAFRSSGRDVRIRGLTIEKHANRSQNGAIHAAGLDSRLTTGWIVEDCEVRLNHGTGILMGDSMTVRGNRILKNGQLGVGGGGVGSLVENNEIAFNNYADFDPFWEAGGSKFFLTRSLTVRNNFVHHNDGTGLWTDIDNVGALYEGNIVTENGLRGIQHEISFNAVIRDNVVERNGLDFDPWLWGAQILVQNSSGVEVYNNKVVVAAEGGDGIALIQQNRGGSSLGQYLTRNNKVYDNEITYLGAQGQSGAVADFNQQIMINGGNSFDSNIHRVSNSARRHWAWGESVNWNEFRGAGQEINGKLGPIIGP